MPYVNIPDSKLHGTIARLVGKMQGKVMSKVLNDSTNITNSLNRQGCPTEKETKRLRRKLSRNQVALNQVAGRISKFRSILFLLLILIFFHAFSILYISSIKS